MNLTIFIINTILIFKNTSSIHHFIVITNQTTQEQSNEVIEKYNNPTVMKNRKINILRKQSLIYKNRPLKLKGQLKHGVYTIINKINTTLHPKNDLTHTYLDPNVCFVNYPNSSAPPIQTVISEIDEQSLLASNEKSSTFVASNVINDQICGNEKNNLNDIFIQTNQEISFISHANKITNEFKGILRTRIPLKIINTFFKGLVRGIVGSNRKTINYVYSSLVDDLEYNATKFKLRSFLERTQIKHNVKLFLDYEQIIPTKPAPVGLKVIKDLDIMKINIANDSNHCKDDEVNEENIIRKRLIADLDKIKSNLINDINNVKLTESFTEEQSKRYVDCFNEDFKFENDFYACNNIILLYKLYKSEINKILPITNEQIIEPFISKLLFNMPELLFYFSWDTLNEDKILIDTGDEENQKLQFIKTRNRIYNEIVKFRELVDECKLIRVYPINSAITKHFAMKISQFRVVIIEKLKILANGSLEYNLYSLAMQYKNIKNNCKTTDEILSSVHFFLTFTKKAGPIYIQLSDTNQKLKIRKPRKLSTKKKSSEKLNTNVFIHKRRSSDTILRLYLYIEYLESKKGIFHGESIKNYFIIPKKYHYVLIHNDIDSECTAIYAPTYNNLLTFLWLKVEDMLVRI